MKGTTVFYVLLIAIVGQVAGSLIYDEIKKRQG